jgi:pantoate--beta-alanine ligase
MKTVTTVAAMRAWRRGVAGDVGFVPTMGYLHAGHASLVERARRENAAVVSSVFVNPTQFAPHEDLSRYPRDLARDERLLAEAGCDLLFAPAAGEVYPPGFGTSVDVGPVAEPLEGARRPGHFRGVATVVLKLFGMVQPARAYFGHKDAQQLAVIRRLVRDLDLPVTVIGCPTMRDADGLALSSRNAYLGPAERAAAPVLYRALQAAERLWRAGERDAARLRAQMQTVLAAEPLARVDYASVVDADTFRELERLDGPALLALAVRIGPARLIDNLPLAPPAD